MTASLQIGCNFAFYFTFLFVWINIDVENRRDSLIIRCTTTMYKPENCLRHPVFSTHCFFAHVFHSDMNNESSLSFCAFCDVHGFLCGGGESRVWQWMRFFISLPFKSIPANFPHHLKFNYKFSWGKGPVMTQSIKLTFNIVI